MTTTADTATTTATDLFGPTAADALVAAERSLTRAQNYAAPFGPIQQAEYAMRDLVIAQTEVALYAAAIGAHGEEILAGHLARLIGATDRTTDAFARAAVEAQREGALRVLRKLRGVMAPATVMELIEQI